jgi:hypothetical protein
VGWAVGLALQGNFGGTGTASSAGYGGVFNLLGSNVNEKTQFAVIKSVTVASTGAQILTDSAPWYRFADFSFIPSSTMGSSGIVSVTLSIKGNT